MKFLVIGGIDLSQNKETEIQLQYIEKCKELLAKSSTKHPTFHIQNEGCQMNSIQTESIAAIMEKMGYEMVDTEDADAVVFNTCTVRENANLKIYGHLGHLKSIKKKNPELKIILFGCMMQEPEVIEKIHKEYSFVDLVFGTHNFHKFPELFYRSLNTEGQIIDVWKESDEIVEGMPSDRKYSFKTGVNIMFGCNNFCSYCIVPYVRGRERSRKPEEIIREIREFVADGVIEVMLLGQNVNSYGKTLEERYFANATNIFTEREAAKILKKGCRPGIQDVTKPLYNRVKDKDAVTKMQYVDLHLWLVHDILMKGG